MNQHQLDIIYRLASHPISPLNFDNPNKFLFWFFENLKPIFSESNKLLFTHIQYFDFNTSNDRYFREGRLVGFPTLYGTNDPEKLIRIKLEVITFLTAVSLMQKTNFEGVRSSINAFQDRMIIESISKDNGENFSIVYDDKSSVITLNLPDFYEKQISEKFYESVKNRLVIPPNNNPASFPIISDEDINNSIEFLFSSGIAQSLIPDMQRFLNSERVISTGRNMITELQILNRKVGLITNEIALKNYYLTALLHSWIKSCKYNYMISSAKYNEFKEPASYAIFLIVSNEKVDKEKLSLLHISLNIAFNALNEIQKWCKEERSDNITKSKPYFSNEPFEKLVRPKLIYKSQSMQKLDREIDLVSRSNEPILLIGETGTGKDLLAYEIHKRSKNDKPFKVISEADYEIDFYDKNKLGEFGTIYFSEITDIPIALQTKLFHFLKNQYSSSFDYIEKPNSFQQAPRFIFSSNTNPLKSIKDGKLREDFYYQINVVNLIIPPLRERIEDIHLLAQHFVKLHSLRIRGKEYKIQKQAIDFLSKKDFKGNVRELEHLIISAIVKSENEVLEPSSFFEIILQKDEFYSDLYDINFEGKFKIVNKRFKKIYFEKLLRKVNGSVSEAAKISGLSGPTIYGLIRTLKIKI